MTVGIVIVAAGSGTRLGAGIPKAFVRLGDATLLEHCLRTIAELSIAQLVIAVPESRRDETLATLAVHRLPFRASVVIGGAERQDSVRAALDELEDTIETVLVHDAARPLTPAAVFERVIDEVRSSDCGVVPVIQVVDTLKRIHENQVVETVDRSRVRAVQTPQGFPRRIIEESSRAIIGQHTDDAGIVQVAGYVVKTVAGDERAFKITTPQDLERGAAMQQMAVPEIRVGTGTDAHAFEPGITLWLAGLEWPGETGLAGHSDGDAVCHAMVDALLSAAGLGDIGGMFGTGDPRFEGARSTGFLEGALKRLHEEGWQPLNVAVQVIGNRPKFAPRRAEAELLLSGIVGAPVSVSATTTDGMGFTGRGEGIAVVANALIARRSRV